MCFLFNSGSASSLLPVVKPTQIERIHGARKNNIIKIGRIVPIDSGQGLSPNTKIQKKPAANPVRANALTSETKKPGTANRRVYRIRFFIF
jgi:hypothetical protein